MIKYILIALTVIVTIYTVCLFFEVALSQDRYKCYDKIKYRLQYIYPARQLDCYLHEEII